MKIEKTYFERMNAPLVDLGQTIKDNKVAFASYFDVNIEYEDKTINLIDTDMVIEKMLNDYSVKHYVFNVNVKDMKEDTVTFYQIVNDCLLKNWYEYKKKQMYNWERIVVAWYSEFNPIENYDRYEERRLDYFGAENDNLKIIGSETNEVTRTGSEKNVNTQSGSETNTQTISDIDSSTEKGVSPYDGGGTIGGGNNPISDGNKDYVKSEKVLSHTTAHTDTSKLTFDGRSDTNELAFLNRKDTSQLLYTDRENQTKKSFDGRYDKEEMHVHGNIGVTTSTAMVNEYIRQRTKNLADMILDDFFNKYCTIL